MNATKETVNSAVNVVLAVSEAIRELGRVPSGQLYAHLCGKFSLSQYESILSILERAGVIQVSNAKEIVWTGPKA
jgi:hypothetical protein